MYTPVPLLALLALLAAAFSLVSSPHAQTVVRTLLVATLGGSVLHLQVLAGARLAMIIIPVLILTCGTLLSFSTRLSPVLFLVFILTTLGITLFLFFTRRPSPSPIEKPPRSPTKTSLSLLLLIQLTYSASCAFSLLTYSRSSSPQPPLLSSLLTSHAPLPKLVLFTILDAVSITLTLATVFAAYYLHRRRPPVGPPLDIEPKRPTIPRRPNIPILSPPTTPTPTRVHSIVLPSSPPASLFKSGQRHRRAGLSTSSSFFSPRPKRAPLPLPLTSAHTPTPTPTPDSDELELRCEGLPEDYPQDLSIPSKLDLDPPSPTSTSTSSYTSSASSSTYTSSTRRSIDTALESLPPGTRARMSPGPIARQPALVRVRVPTPLPTRVALRSPVTVRYSATGAREADMMRERDFTDLTDPFAPASGRALVVRRERESAAPPSSYRLGKRQSYDSYPYAQGIGTRTGTRMSTWGRLPLTPPPLNSSPRIPPSPPSPSPSVRFTTYPGHTPSPRRRTPPPPPSPSPSPDQGELKTRRRRLQKPSGGKEGGGTKHRDGDGDGEEEARAMLM